MTRAMRDLSAGVIALLDVAARYESPPPGQNSASEVPSCRQSILARETGLLAFETLIDTTIIDTVLKTATHRARPLEGNGEGHFWDSSGKVWNASFPSGHAINTWALASVFAHQYRHNIIVPIIAYTLASTVVVARLVGNRTYF